MASYTVPSSTGVCGAGLVASTVRKQTVHCMLYTSAEFILYHLKMTSSTSSMKHERTH